MRDGEYFHPTTFFFGRKTESLVGRKIKNISDKNPDITIYNLAVNGDSPKFRYGDLEEIVRLKPEIVFYGISYRDFNQSSDLTNLKTNSASLKELAPQLNWDIVFESRIQELQKHMVFKTRAGQNKSLEMALEPLFWRLRDFGKGQAEQVRLVYYLFVEFGLDDYGKDIDKYDSPDGKLSEVEVIQHERIRKQFQQPAIKSRDQYAEIFGWDA